MPTASPVTTIPTALIPDTPYLASMANATRTINMSADSLMVMDGPFYFNGNSFDMMRIDYRIPLDNIEIWTLKDSTMVAHPFHIHDVHFYILDRNGNPPAATERGRKDVLLIEPNETVRFITKFDDFADTITPYMYHCHILMHEDDGMMGQFIVSQYAASVKNVINSNRVSVYPNPAKNELNIKTENNAGHEKAKIKVIDVLGREIYTGVFADFIKLNTINWAKGVYMLLINNNEYVITEKVVVE
jgi:blue copper oxidase